MLPPGEGSHDMRRLKTSKEINIYRFQFILNYQSKRLPKEKKNYIFSELSMNLCSYKEFVNEKLF